MTETLHNGRLQFPGGAMDFICFGRGAKPLVLLPGLSDGLKTVKGTALPFSFLYRSLAKDFTVWVFSRRENLPAHMTTREMAEDLNAAMEILDLHNASVVGVSQGGMIAQWLAVDHPDKVGKLVLTVTLSRPNGMIRDAVACWTDMARRGDYQGILLDTAERACSKKRRRTARIEYRLLGNFGKPKSFDRFLTQAESCLTHDAYDALPRISCPTLVIGGTEDRIVSGRASEEIAEKIPGSRLLLYGGLGHGLYEEAPDFLSRVSEFCR